MLPQLLTLPETRSIPSKMLTFSTSTQSLLSPTNCNEVTLVSTLLELYILVGCSSGVMEEGDRFDQHFAQGGSAI